MLATYEAGEWSQRRERGLAGVGKESEADDGGRADDRQDGAQQASPREPLGAAQAASRARTISLYPDARNSSESSLDTPQRTG